MRQQDLETDAHHALRRIVRSIDKKLHVQVQDGPTAQDPFLTLALSQGQLQASMEVAVEEVRRALENARERAALREKIKRARIRMWFPAKPERFFSTKAIRPGAESFANVRTGGRR
jgi:hypothetical protein